jgi:predicted transposase YbfD/YdcC
LRAALIPERVNEVVRQRWSVKNSLYFRLDVVMNEDRQGKTRMGHRSQGLAMLPHMLLNAMR